MWVKLRHKIVFAILCPVFAVFLLFKYGYKFSKFRCNIKKPYLIISNHVTTLDPFMIAVSFNMPIYFMASDDLFSLKFFSPIIKYLVAPIAKTKSSSDLKTVRDCFKIAKEGGSICVFPEGNRTYNGISTHVPFAIVKLVKMLKIPLLIYKIEGGYGVQPRWSTNIRRGKMYGSVYRVLEFENYRNLSDDDLYKYICKNLYSNAFNEAVISNNLYKSAKKAEYIERFLYACPDCGKFCTLYSLKNNIICTNCKLSVEYGEDLKLKTVNGKCDFENVKEWDNFQKTKIKSFDLDTLNSNEIIFEDKNILLKENIRCERKIELGGGNICLYNDRLEISADKNYVFFIKDISSVTIFGKNRLSFYHNNDIYQILGDKRFNALKYQNMFYHIKNNIEGVSDEFLGL